jgi:hypothetical protein
MAASHPLPQTAGFASNVSRDVGQQLGFVRFAAYFSLLDTGLRRYDDLMDYLGLFQFQINRAISQGGFYPLDTVSGKCIPSL